MKPRLLDLFCGAGGAAVGYHRAGFSVVGVDNRPQPNYPFEFIQADALRWLDKRLDRADEWGSGLFGFDAIHTSPPCQASSSMKSMHNAGEHEDLIAPTRELLAATGLPYVIENVVGADLHWPVMLCGSSFGLDVRRHRLFEPNWPLMVAPCAHGQQVKEFSTYDHGPRFSPVVPVYGAGGGKAAEHWAEAMGIDWMTRSELAQAIPPAYTELIGHQLMQHLQVTACA